MRSGGRSCGLWRLGDGGSGADDLHCRCDHFRQEKESLDGAGAERMTPGRTRRENKCIQGAAADGASRPVLFSRETARPISPIPARPYSAASDAPT